jgi:AmmeMemoRadiSam system protein A
VRKLQDFSEEDSVFLLKIARETIENGIMRLKKEVPQRCPKKFLEKGACFVSLHQKGHLRGCIGSLEAHEPLIKNVIRNAYNAAFKDPRFMPLQQNEMEDVDIEISILTKPEELKYSDYKDLLKKLKAPIDGVILEKNHRSATFLPVVWEHFARHNGYDKEGFLAELAIKAGLGPDDWKDAKIEIYHAILVREND